MKYLAFLFLVSCMVKKQENMVDIVDKIDRLDKEMSTRNFQMVSGGNQIIDTLNSFPDSLVVFGYYDQAGKNHYDVGYHSKDSIL